MEDGRISYEYGLTYEGLKKAQKDIESRLHSVEEAVNETGASFDGLSADAAKDLNIVGESVSEIAKTVGEAMSGIEDEAERADFVIDTISAAIEEIETQSESLGDSGAKEILGSVVEELQKMVTAAEEFKQNELPLDPIPPKAQSARAALREMTEQLVDMKMRGQENTEEYKQLLEQVGNLKDTMMDTQQAIGGMASDTAKLDAVLGAANLTAGGFSAVMGAMNLVGASEDTKQLAEAQKKLQSVIAITTGLQAVQNALQKQSNLMLGIARLKALAAAKAEQIKNAATAKGVVATKAATLEQAAFNMVANANPYVLLATALTSLVGALVAFSKNTYDAERAANRFRMEIDYLNDSLNEIQRSQQQILDIHTVFGYSDKEIRDMREEFAKLNYEQVKAEKERMEQQRESNDKNFNQEQYERILELESKYRHQYQDIRHENTIEELKEQKSKEKEMLNLRRQEEDAKIALMTDGYRKQEEIIKKNYFRQREDLMRKIGEDSNLTVEQKNSINAQINSLYDAETKELSELWKKYAAEKEANRLKLVKMEEEAAREEIEYSLEIEKAVIDAKAEGNEKLLAQMKLDHKRRMNEIDKESKEEADRERENNKAIWLAKHTGKTDADYYASDTYKSMTNGLTEHQQDEIDARKSQREKNENEVNLRREKDFIQSILDQYRDYDAQRTELERKFNDDMAALGKLRTEENSKQVDAAVKQAKRQFAEESFKIDMSQIDTKAYKTVAERMEAINEAYDRYIANLREAGTSEAEIAKIERERVEITGRIAELNAKIDDLEGQKMIALNNGDVETVKRLNEEIAKLTEELEGLNKAGEAKGFKQSIKDWAKSLSASDIAGYLDGIAGGLEKIGEVAGNEGLSNAGEAISGIGNAVSNIAQGAASGGWIGAVIAAVGTIAEEVINVIAANEELKSAIRQANLDKWVEDQKRSMETSGIFGDDAVARVNASIQVMNNASEKLKGMYSEMEKQAIDRTRKSSYANPLGFIENSVDTWLEEVQGFNANVLSQENSMFAAFKEGLDKGYKGIENYVLKTQDRSGFANFLGIQDEFGNLKDVVEGLGYDLYDQYGNLNSEALQAVLDTYEDLGAADRKWMEEAMAYSDEYAEAMENIADYLGSLFDSVADDIAEALIDSFETGSDAAEAMGETVSKVGRQMAKDIIKNLIISTYFEGMADDFKQKIAENGMTADTASYIVTSFKSAIQQMEGESDYWNSIVESLSSMWNNAEEASKGLASGLATASQDSIDMLTGQMNAVRVAQLNMNRLMDSVILEIAGFHRDYKDLTADTHRKLDRIVSNTSEQGSLVRGMGIYFN